MSVELLKELPGLGLHVPPEEIAEVSSSLRVEVLELPEGPWEPPPDPGPEHLGFIILSGIVLREVSIGPDWSAEMLGDCSILRPWLEDASSFVDSRWETLEEAQLGILDVNAATALGRSPHLLGEILERAIRRSRALAVHAVIEGVHRIDQRLLLLLWHLAEQHSDRTDGPAEVPVRLTHAHLARLVGSRRPTVTTALGDLERTGRIRRTPWGTWLLLGEPPLPAA